MSIYEEVEIEDMEWEEEEQQYTYPCPCGDKFIITLVRLDRCDGWPGLAWLGLGIHRSDAPPLRVAQPPPTTLTNQPPT